ncbi:MAG TPA: metal-sulfur cluster assembly factor [Terriglobales bacterium]|nr:metal-sulfur cluster assembly factor [Terriglobales bacterium]
MKALKDCYDPEIPVSVVDLGLIYKVKIHPTQERHVGGGHNVEVEMTLTAPGCPAHNQISQQVKERIERMPGVASASVNVVWSPPWTPDRISQSARQKLGID